MGVVECEGESGNAADHSLGFARIWRKRTDVCFDGKYNVVHLCLLDSPGQLILRSLPGISGRFVLFKVDAWQRRHVWRAEMAGVFKRPQKLIASMLPTSRVAL